MSTIGELKEKRSGVLRSDRLRNRAIPNFTHRQKLESLGMTGYQTPHVVGQATRFAREGYPNDRSLIGLGDKYVEFLRNSPSPMKDPYDEIGKEIVEGLDETRVRIGDAIDKEVTDEVMAENMKMLDEYGKGLISHDELQQFIAESEAREWRKARQKLGLLPRF